MRPRLNLKGRRNQTKKGSRCPPTASPIDESRHNFGSTHALFPAGQLVPFILVTFLFFLWGIPNNLNDVLIRQFMKSFELPRFQAGLVQSAFYMGYFLLAIPASLLMKRAGYQAGFITGLLLLGAGAFLFWPAALVGSYGFFLVRTCSLWPAGSRFWKRRPIHSSRSWAIRTAPSGG